MNWLFIMMLISSTMITINSSNWMGMWMGMEINLMSFIPLINKPNNMKSSQSSIIYFLVQSMGSMIMLFSIMMNSAMMLSPNNMNEFMKPMLTMALLMKMGGAPLHKWFPEMMNNMNWKEMMLLMTLQKLAPMFVMSSMIMNSWMMYMSIILSTIIGAVGGINTTSLRKIMAYSSINHLGWMMMMMSMQMMWGKYLMLYTIMVLMTCLFFSYYNSYNINQVINKSTSFMEKYSCSSIMLSMGGLPPLLGFLPKWMVIQSMINSNLLWMMLFMMMMSMVTLFYYLRLISPLLLIYSTANKWNMKKNNNTKMMSIMYLNFMLPMMLIISFY